MDLLFRYAWGVFIGVTIVNYFLIKARVQEHIDKNPDLKADYDNILNAMLIYGTIPWLIMAMGNLTGQTHTVDDYFHPRTLNPFVLLFHVYFIVIWILAVRWIYVKNGADLLARHPGVFNRRGLGASIWPTATSIKIVFALALLDGLVGMALMWLTDFLSFPVK